jgi:acyl-CoA thioesterase I
MITRRIIISGLALAWVPPAFAASEKPPIITILGDSITAGLGLDAKDALANRLRESLDMRGIKAVVRGAGVSGDTTAGGLGRLDFSVEADTTVCIIELGGNDYLQSVTPNQIQANLVEIVNRLQARNVRVIIAAGLAPKNAAGAYGRDFDAAFVAAAKATGATLIPDWLNTALANPAWRQADGIHPNADGVKVLAEALAPAVAAALTP